METGRNRFARGLAWVTFGVRWCSAFTTYIAFRAPPQDMFCRYLIPFHRFNSTYSTNTKSHIPNIACCTISCSVPRVMETGGRAPVPIALGATGALATWYYQKKAREFRYGV
jgi:hypothetical protein